MGDAAAGAAKPGRRAGESRSVDAGTDQLLCRIEERVAVVTLNRPEARNALSAELKEALPLVEARWHNLDPMKSIGVVQAKIKDKEPFSWGQPFG